MAAWRSSLATSRVYAVAKDFRLGIVCRLSGLRGHCCHIKHFIRITQYHREKHGIIIILYRSKEILVLAFHGIFRLRSHRLLAIWTDPNLLPSIHAHLHSTSILLLPIDYPTMIAPLRDSITVPRFVHGRRDDVTGREDFARIAHDTRPGIPSRDGRISSAEHDHRNLHRRFRARWGRRRRFGFDRW